MIGERIVEFVTQSVCTAASQYLDKDYFATDFVITDTNPCFLLREKVIIILAVRPAILIAII